MKYFLFLLYPFSRLWSLIYFIRRELYELGFFNSTKVSLPVISVGNIALGGSGKTPMALWLANYFHDKGLKPLILTRGYKGELENSSGVIAAGENKHLDAKIYGDEPLMMAKNLKSGHVLIGRDRINNLLNNLVDLGSDIIILDDGFQHLKIQRDLDIVLLDATLNFNRLYTAPLGYLREDLQTLKKADFVFLSRSNEISENKLKLFRDLIGDFSNQKDLGEFSYKAKAFKSITGKEFNLEEILAGQSVCMTGIANALSFLDTIKSLGITPLNFHRFPDHFHFTGAKVESLIQECRDQGHFLICTEKDIVKLKRFADYEKVVYLKVDLDFTKGEQELCELIDSKLF